MSTEHDMTTEDWVAFLKQQADHTRDFRHTLYEKVNVKTCTKILDVGCGTGVITAEISALTKGDIIGIDIDQNKLAYAREVVDAGVTLINADTLNLPFKDRTFDLVVFSVVLMHIKEQQKAVNEMARVTQKNGIVLATMEPDHAGYLSYPENKAHSYFIRNLEEKGSDSRMGRKLKYLFCNAGLSTEIGITAHDIDIMNTNPGEALKHFQLYFQFSQKNLLKYGWTKEEIETYKQEQIQLIESNLYFMFLPVFYAIGRKKT